MEIGEFINSFDMGEQSLYVADKGLVWIYSFILQSIMELWK